jgi:hypothetical protein
VFQRNTIKLYRISLWEQAADSNFNENIAANLSADDNSANIKLQTPVPDSQK